MREIKFRGKDVDSGEWHYGSLVTYPNGRCEIVVFDDSEILEYEVDVESVGQFTGLYDANGEEIYEGDVIERFQPNPHYRNGVYYDGNAIYGVVQYIEGGFYITTVFNEAFKMCANPDDMWVQGNIHDTPQLVTNGND